MIEPVDIGADLEKVRAAFAAIDRRRAPIGGMRGGIIGGLSKSRATA